MIRVLVVDDQPLVRSGVTAWLADEADLEVVGEAGDGREAVAAATRLRPDVVLMDLRMPVLSGVQATRMLLERLGPLAPRVLVLTTFDEDDLVDEALRAGAVGFLLKDAAPEDVVRAIRVVGDGGGVLAPTVASSLIRRIAADQPATDRDPAGALAELTARERDVLGLIAAGRTNDEIADELVVAPTTVKTHVRSLLRKLDARDRVGLVVIAHRNGLL